MELYLGIDFGTSGARAIVIDSNSNIHDRVDYPLVKNDIKEWEVALWSLFAGLNPSLKSNIRSIALNGTSATVLLCDSKGNPIDNAILYNDDRGITVLDRLKTLVPENHPVLNATSGLAKLYWWYGQPLYKNASHFLHQADWLAFLLHGKLGISDYHNALKLGYDVEKLDYPGWLKNSPVFEILPEISTPGTVIDYLKPDIASRFGFSPGCRVTTGTTDSIAAFIASGARSLGDGVTSLGSTLVLKLLSDKAVNSAKYGIYAHRLGGLWLIGGASNTGGAVLREFFSDGELEELSRGIDADRESILDYYPLLKPGDRFPVNDPLLPPRLFPRPDDPREFLHGLLESMARIEALGYSRLQELGANSLKRVYTAGGGAKNPVWTAIRQRRLGVPVLIPERTEAAYGSALLARDGLNFG